MSTLISHLRCLDPVESKIKQYCIRQGIPFIRYQARESRSLVHCRALLTGQEISFYVSADRLLETYAMQDARFSVQHVGEKFLSTLYGGLLTELSPGVEWFSVPLEGIVVQQLECTFSSEKKLYSTGDGADYIWFAEDVLASIAIPEVETETDWSGLPCPVKISLGSTLLPLKDIRHLNSGDVLWLINKCTALYIGHQQFCSVQYEQEHFSVSEDIMDDQTSNVSMDDLWSEDGLKFNIEFVLCETSMTLADISQMQPGDVLDSVMGIDDNKITVQLRVQGKTVATGELVLLNERLAVEIEKVYGAA